MKSKKQLFYDKVQCIYNTICEEDLNYFTNLFYIKSKAKKTTFENRKSYLRKNWLKKQDKVFNPRMFKSEYFEYPFSGLTINGRGLFANAEEFLQIDIEQFCQRIKNYTALQVELKIDKENLYRYLYVYNINGVKNNQNIGYYEIEYRDSTLHNEVSIVVKPPQNKSLSLSIEPYHGKFKYQKNKIILNFENNNDYISAIFNTDLINNYTEYLVGIGVGIADINQKISVAKKVILTKEKIEDVNNIYPIINETEIISALENSYKFQNSNNNYNSSHLKNYIEKMSRLNILFNKLSKQQQYNSFYEQLAFNEFSSTVNIFKKLKNNQPYYVYYHKRIIDILVKSYPHEAYKEIYMVMPIEEDNIFAQQSSKAIELQDELIKLSDKVAIEIIFVIDSCKKPLVYEFKQFLSKIEQKIRVHFAFKHHIENEVNSIDFIYTNKKNFVITKFLRANNTVFNLYQDKATINGHEAIYRKILNRSISYNVFMKDKHKLCSNTNPILETLKGEWYFYVYGSQKLWEDKLIIFLDGRVDYYSEGKKTESGIIVNREYQSVILLTDIISKRLFTLIFDHEAHKISKAFTLKVIGKQYKSDSDILSIGVLSREPIEMTKVYNILGDIDDVRMLENGNVSDRLSKYLIEEYGYY